MNGQGTYGGIASHYLGLSEISGYELKVKPVGILYVFPTVILLSGTGMVCRWRAGFNLGWNFARWKYDAAQDVQRIMTVKCYGGSCSPQIHMLKSKHPKVMAWVVVAFGRWLRHEGEGLLNGIRILVKVTTELPGPFPHVRTQRAVCHSKEGSHPTTLAPSSQTSSFQNCGQYISAVYKLSSLQYIVGAAQKH